MPTEIQPSLSAAESVRQFIDSVRTGTMPPRVKVQGVEFTLTVAGPDAVEFVSVQAWHRGVLWQLHGTPRYQWLEGRVYGIRTREKMKPRRIDGPHLGLQAWLRQVIRVSAVILQHAAQLEVDRAS